MYAISCKNIFSSIKKLVEKLYKLMSRRKEEKEKEKKAVIPFGQKERQSNFGIIWNRASVETIKNIRNRKRMESVFTSGVFGHWLSQMKLSVSIFIFLVS